MRFIVIVLFILGFGVSVLAQQGDDKFENKSSHSTWNLPPLTKQERFQRIEKFIKPYSFELYHSKNIEAQYKEGEEKECLAALNHLKNIKKEDILEPVYIAQSMNDSWVQDFLKQCHGALEPNKNYVSMTGWNDGNRPYLYYLEATANMEFYDVSRFLGGSVWTFLGEGAKPKECLNPDNMLCKNLDGYLTIGQVFDLEECNAYSTLNIGKRIYISSRQKPVSDVAYFKSNNFFSLIAFDDALFSMNYSTDMLSENSCLNTSELCSHAPAVMTSSGTILNLDSVAAKNSQQKPLQCIFQLKDINKQGEL